MKKLVLLIALVSIAFSINAQQIPFQGRLLENGVVVNGTKDFVFTIDVDGNSWTETHTGVTVSEGLYSVVLGAVTPLPDNLYYGTDSRSLQISIAGVALTPITIYAAPNSPNFNYVGDGSNGMAALKVNMSGSFTGSWAAIESYSATTNNDNYALYGEASGSGNNNIGVYGYALNDAKFISGLRGIANGVGNGETGFGVGSYNHGVWGTAQGNSWGNVGAFGQAKGTEGVDNIGVVGWSSVASSDINVLNVGTLGTAKGPGINKGVVGNAYDGIENWAGWFNGDVKITGNLSLEGVTTTAVSSDRFTVGVNEFAFWHAGDLAGNGNYGAQISFPGGIDGGNNAIQGGSSLGNKYWDATYPESGYLHISSASGLRASLEANSNGSTEWATLNLGNTDGRYSLLNAGDLAIYNVNGNKAAQLFSNANGAGVLYTFNNFGVNTGWFGTQDDKGGLWQIRGDDGAGNSTGTVLSGFWGGMPSFVMEDANAQPGVVYEIQTNGTDNWSFLNLYKSAANGSSNSNTVEIHGGESRITLRSPDGTSEVTIDAYNGVTGGPTNANYTNLDISDPNILGGQGFASINIVNDGGGADPSGYSGELFLQGTNTPNVQLGGKPWENNNLPYMNLFGSTSDGGGWFHSNLNMSIESDGTDEWASLALHKTNIAGQTIATTINLDGQNGNIGVSGNISAAGFDSGPVVIDGGASGNMWGLNELTANSVVAGDAFDAATQISGTSIDVFAGGSGSDDGFGAASFGAGFDGAENFGNMSLKSTGAEGALNMGFAGPNSSEGFFSIWVNNGGGVGEYALMNVQSGGPGGAVFGSLNLNDDLGNSVSINGYGDIGVTGNISSNNINTGDINSSGGIYAANNLMLGDAYDNGIHVNDGAPVISIWSGGDGSDNGAETILLDGTTGDITANSVTQTSDRRYKKDIETIENALGNTLKLRGVSYTWKDSRKSQRNQIGVIAQEVETIYPEFVHTNKEGFKSVNYAQMTAVLIEAVKELNAKVEELKNENTMLKAVVIKPADTTQIDTLQKQLELLTARFNELVGTSASSQVSDK